MPNTQEWQSENSVRAFPFVSALDDGLPRDFIADLRFFPDRWTQREVYLSSVSYSVANDQYSLELKYVDDSTQAIQGVLGRLLDGASRINRPSYLFTGESVLAFSPGKSWEDPSWMYADPDVPEDTTKNFSADQTLIESELVNPGPKTIRRIFIAGEPIPDPSTWGRGVEQKLIGGYNVNLGRSSNELSVGNITNNNTPSLPFIEISVEGGGGLGYPPDSAQDRVVRTLNGIEADSQGNVKLSAQDCLNIFAPKNTPHHLQASSDCLPCCGCDQYRAFSAAISRRSAKLKELCDLLGQAITANVALYNDAVAKINENRLPIVRIRNMRVYSDRFRISVQNICSIPVYAHVGISVGGGLVSISDFQPEEVELIRTLNEIQDNPLPPTNKDYNNTNPDMPAGSWTAYIVGPGSQGSTIYPIQPGSYSDITFTLTSPGAIDLRDMNLVFNIQSNGLYGADLTYGCKKDVYSGRVVEDPYLPQPSCSGGDTQVRYKIVPTV